MPWRALARRGMLWSEVQAFDVLDLGRAEGVVLGDRHYIEAMLCACGRLARGVGSSLTPGELMVLPPGEPEPWAAGEDGATIVCLRLLPSRTASLLPARVPVVEPGDDR